MKSTPASHPTRRRFLQQTARAAVAGFVLPTVVPSTVMGSAGGVTPGNTITVAMIGAGSRGLLVLQSFLAEADARVVAVCDVKPEQREEASAIVNQHYQNKDCATYSDFREVLVRSDIDAVVVATPDHWHVLIAIAAVRAGKDVYVEKPMGLSVGEDQALRAAVRATGRIFQFGTQQRSSAYFRRACEIVRNGRIGRLKHINTWCTGSVPGGSVEVVPVPPGFDYDRWLGPAPFKPYRKDLCSADPLKKTWWYNTDYALGFIAGWGVHPMDIAYWGYPEMMNGPLELGGTATIPTLGACNTATTWNIDYRFASGVTLNFQGLPIASNGPESITKARLWQERYGQTRAHGTAFEGADGWVLVDRGHVATYPEDIAKENPEAYKVRLPHSDYHAQDFLQSVRSRRPAIANIEEAFQSDVLCHLAFLATTSERRLKWNPKSEKFIGDEAANRRLEVREMRKPWTL